LHQIVSIGTPTISRRPPADVYLKMIA